MIWTLNTLKHQEHPPPLSFWLYPFCLICNFNETLLYFSLSNGLKTAAKCCWPSRASPQHVGVQTKRTISWRRSVPTLKTAHQHKNIAWRRCLNTQCNFMVNLIKQSYYFKYSLKEVSFWENIIETVFIFQWNLSTSFIQNYWKVLLGDVNESAVQSYMM